MIGGGMSHKGMFRRKVSSFCPYLPGLYTEEEIDDLVFIDGYVPVYDAVEFDKIRTGASEVMGGCTKWGGTYTTGGDKKYIQVGVCDFTSFGTWTTAITVASGFIYDGNEIASTNISSTDMLFTGTGLELKNARFANCSLSSVNQNVGLIYSGYGLTVTNIEAILITVVSTGVLLASSRIGGLFGSITGVVNVDGIYFDGNVTGEQNAIGGVFGSVGAASGTIQNVSNSATTTVVCSRVGTYGIIGGIGGVVRGCSILNCINNSDISGAVRTGGLFGDASTTVSGCVNNGNISAINGGCAGIVGVIFTGTGTLAISNCTNNGDIENTGGTSAGIITNPNGNITNCLNTGSITGSSTTGGICSAAGNITISGCRNDGLIDGGSYTGGIVGDGGNIVFCQNHGNITSSNYAGGIVGRMSDNTSITTSVNFADIEKTLIGLSAGGVVGVAASQTINISECANIGGNVTSAGQGVGGVVGDCRAQMQDCYSLGGTITGTGRVGGLCGSCIGGSQVATWDNCFSTSEVVSGGTKGGLCGEVFSGTLTVNNSYWDTDTSGILTSPRGTGQTTVQLQTPVTNSGIYSSWTIPPWDFGTATDYPTLTTVP